MKFSNQMRVRLRRWGTRNVFGWVPASLKATLVACSSLFDPHAVASATGVSNRWQAAWRFVADDQLGPLANRLFDPAWYRTRYDFNGSAADAFLHYWLLGDRAGLQPHPWFDARFVRHAYRMPRWRLALKTFLERWHQGMSGHPLFDAAWYRESNPDVAATGTNPLLHFVLYGVWENRSPNEYFDPDWYAARNPDVSAVGMPPALHFALHGARELRDPGPNFGARSYALDHADRSIGKHQLDPLAHYLAVGRASGILLRRRAIDVDDLCRTLERGTRSAFGAVDIIIPVYRGLAETRACIESVLNTRNRTRVRIRLHNDASPEPDVTQYLRWVATEHSDVQLVENAQNLGFVRTVNDAMRRSLAGDCASVLLLNSDTVVSHDWVDRMAAHAEHANDVATVTALSNNATICSYPKLGANTLPPGMETAELDAIAATTNAGMAVDVPTGVGFCMLITRSSLEHVGLFDEEAFGRGYGEENDFCLRSSRAGFRNLLALDVFVAHVGEVSFAEVSKPGKMIAEAVIRERYPDYPARVSDFCMRDPALPYRLRITFARWRAARCTVRAVLSHDLGGGTERHIQERMSRYREDGLVIVIRPSRAEGSAIRLQHDDPYDGFDVEVEGLTGARFARLLQTMGVGAADIHHVMGFGAYLREGLAIAGIPFDFTVHDYFTICPQVTLSTADSRYCGEPDPAGCDACIAARPSHGAADIRNWRMHNAWLLEGSRRLRAPSIDCATRIERYVRRTPEVTYHEPIPVSPPRRRGGRVPGSLRPYVVLILGALAPHKGRDRLLDVIRHVHRRGMPIRFHLIGDTQGEVPADVLPRLSWTGRYQDSELSGLIDAADADAILFAAPIPETYSYTLSSAMHSGLPIIATSIGALPERLTGYDQTLIVPHDIDGVELAAAIERFLVACATAAQPQ